MPTKKKIVSKTLAKKHVIVRTYSAGVFAGYVKSRKGAEIVMTDCRRLWQWAGAASLSQLAIDGTSNPGGCKFPEATKEQLILGVIEVIPTTKKAQDSIASVSIWKA